MQIKKYVLVAVALMLLASFTFVSPIFAQNDRGSGRKMMPNVVGKVTAVSGNTITVASDRQKTATTYTVDATNAKIMIPQSTTATVADLKTGDYIIVQGTVNGTAVSALSIIDQGQRQANQKSKNQARGFFGSIGNFFSRIFGF